MLHERQKGQGSTVENKDHGIIAGSTTIRQWFKYVGRDARIARKKLLLTGHHPKLDINSAKNTGIWQLWADHLSSSQIKANPIYLTVV